MLARYRHISFDLDGTLVHTVPEYRYAIVPKVVHELGGAIKEERAIDRFWFEASRDEVIRREFKVEPASFWHLFRILDTSEQRSRHTRAYDDAELTLRKLKAMGKITSVITGAPHWIADMEVQKLNGAPLDMHFSITDSQFNGKPDPASFHFILKKLNVSPRETLYVGNSNEDAYYARNAGADFLYLQRKEHQFNLRDYAVGTIDSLDHLFMRQWKVVSPTAL
ncbi:MAG: HAD-IA family hydrolase [Patescibacteria group bacterium]